MPESKLELLHRTASLARLELTPLEAAQLAPQFESILGHFEILAAIDVDGIPPTLGASDLCDVKRADLPRPSELVQALLANAPDRRETYYAVPKTIGEAG
jgi:aspartyl-tRNA(Asn)/glutamyl-tRNA(Gln) amidotransferase subunit C